MPRPRASRAARLLLLWLTTAPLFSACSSAPTLSDLSGVDELKARFNRDAGKPRVVLLLSPT